MKGIKLVMSMFLEVADVVVPIAKAALNNFKSFSSWLLVTLIGGALQVESSLPIAHNL